MIGDQEASEAGHVAVPAVPGNQHTVGANVPDVKTADRGKRTELSVLGGQEEPGTQALRSVTLGANPVPVPLPVNPFPVLGEPEFLVKAVARADYWVT